MCKIGGGGTHRNVSNVDALCPDLQKSYCAALERRETVLLTLLDKQVEIKQEMIEEARMEVAAARARILAAKEEGQKNILSALHYSRIILFAACQILKLNPVTALLTRKHMDTSFDRAIKQTMLAVKAPTQPEVPLSLLPDITPTITETLDQHGAILQMPPRPTFTDILVTTNTILLKWECPHENNSDVTADRTLTFSLHCHADVPLKLKSKISFKKQLVPNGKQVTPESGFEDFSGSSIGPSSTFPSVPQSLLGSRNISLVALGQANSIITDQVLQDQPAKPKVHTDTKLPEIVKSGVGLPANPSLLPPSLLPSSSAARLNLPPLRQPHNAVAESETDRLSDSTTVSGTLADSEDPPTPTLKKGAFKKNPKRDEISADSSSTLSDATTDAGNLTFTNIGRFCRGFAFEEIYCGEDYSFLYSGLLPGATYYFRVHCHNAAGWGPWSDTVKCTTVVGKS